MYLLGGVADKYDSVEDEYEGYVEAEIPERIQNFARVLAVGDFDLIVIPEVTAGERGEWALSDLSRELNQNHGGNYRHFMSGEIGPGFRITEAMGFLYNPTVVTPEIIPGTTSLVHNNMQWPGKSL